MIPLLDHMEQHLWSDTEAGGDVWNGRWTSDLLSSLLGEAAPTCVDPRSFRKALRWIQQLTGLLQTTQRALYRVRHLELASKEAKTRRAAVAASWQRRKVKASQTLFAAWNIPYQTPTFPRRKVQPIPSQSPKQQPSQTQSLLASSNCWTQYVPAKTTITSFLKSKRPTPKSTTNEHRTSKWKLRKLRHLLLICR